MLPLSARPHQATPFTFPPIPKLPIDKAKQQVLLIDDLDGSEAEQVVKFKAATSN